MRDSVSLPLPFIDLQQQRNRIANEIDAAITRVLDHGAFVMGPEVTELENRLSQYSGTNHTITCSNGTDALLMALMAKDVGPGDAVFVPSFTFTSTAEAPALLGATPVFVDVLPDTFNLDATSLDNAVAAATSSGLKPSCVITVDLFGQPVNFSAIGTVAEDHGMWILDDAAQSFGAKYKNQPIGTHGLMTTTSFYPSKPLGCYGDGGAVFTNDEDLMKKLVSIRIHGQGRTRNKTERIGLTARFDSIQAAILLEKLKIFDDECQRRQSAMEYYNKDLADYVKTPVVDKNCVSVWAQYTIKHIKRDSIVNTLSACGIPTAVFYAHPLHTQEPYKNFPLPDGGLPVTEALAKEVVSLPMHPYLDQETQDRIINAVLTAIS